MKLDLLLVAVIVIDDVSKVLINYSRVLRLFKYYRT